MKKYSIIRYLIIVFILTLPLYPNSSLPTQPGAAVLIVLDNSLSMAHSDSNSLRFDAIDALINSFTDEDMFGSMVFNRTAKILHFPVADSSATNTIRRNSLFQYGQRCRYYSDINIALEKSLKAFDRYSKNERYKCVVLLTDGEEKEKNPDTNDQNESISKLLSNFNKKDIQFFTIALSDNADSDLLRNFSDSNKGIFYKSYQARDLTTIYGNIAIEIQKRKYIYFQKYLIAEARKLANYERKEEAIQLLKPYFNKEQFSLIQEEIDPYNQLSLKVKVSPKLPVFVLILLIIIAVIEYLIIRTNKQTIRVLNKQNTAVLEKISGLSDLKIHNEHIRAEIEKIAADNLQKEPKNKEAKQTKAQAPAPKLPEQKSKKTDDISEPNLKEKKFPENIAMKTENKEKTAETQISLSTETNHSPSLPKTSETPIVKTETKAPQVNTEDEKPEKSKPNSSTQTIPEDIKQDKNQQKSSSNCSLHPNVKSDFVCPVCKQAFCKDCRVTLDEKDYCKECSQKLETKRMLGIW